MATDYAALWDTLTPQDRSQDERDMSRFGETRYTGSGRDYLYRDPTTGQISLQTVSPWSFKNDLLPGIIGTAATIGGGALLSGMGAGAAGAAGGASSSLPAGGIAGASLGAGSGGIAEGVGSAVADSMLAGEGAGTITGGSGLLSGTGGAIGGVGAGLGAGAGAGGGAAAGGLLGGAGAGAASSLIPGISNSTLLTTGGGLLGALANGSGLNSSTSTAKNTIDPRMANYLYGANGTSGLLGQVNNLASSQLATGGLNANQQQGLAMQKSALLDPAYTAGLQQIRNAGSGLLNQGVAGNPFAAGGSSFNPGQWQPMQTQLNPAQSWVNPNQPQPGQSMQNAPPNDPRRGIGLLNLRPYGA